MAGSKAIYELCKPVVAPAMVQQMQSYHQTECSKLEQPDGAAEDEQFCHAFSCAWFGIH